MFKSEVTKTVPTHLQWTKSDGFVPGLRSEVKTIIRSIDWKTITFVGEDFKYNHKVSSQPEWQEAYNFVDSQLEDQDCKVFVVDSSNPDDRLFSCEVVFEKQEKKLTKVKWVKTNNGSTLKLQ